MEYSSKLAQYPAAPSAEQLAHIIKSAEQRAQSPTAEVLKCCLASLDLTSLSCCDTEQSTHQMARRAARFADEFAHLDGVASICIFPPFVESVALEIDGSPLRITSVGGGFPASQTFLEVKALEVAMAVENGADEIDIVINVGKVLSGQVDEAGGELELLRGEATEDTTLKVIIESGALESGEMIRTASLISMMAGADFIKTSTGKIAQQASPEAVVVMAEAIKAYHAATGRKVGIKVAGGVRTPSEAALYYYIVEDILGAEWLCPELFRIGASSLANALLSAIEGREICYF
ncbi:MAG: deoxyribose-phosphate aldolase [Rikenellaceae bacterium]